MKNIKNYNTFIKEGFFSKLTGKDKRDRESKEMERREKEYGYPYNDSDLEKVKYNEKIEPIVNEITNKNIKLSKYIKLKEDIIMGNKIKKANISNNVYRKLATFLLESVGKITITQIYINDYGDNSLVDGVKSYYITLPGYDNTDDYEKLKNIIKENPISLNFLKNNKNVCLITNEEFIECFESVKTWYDDKYKSFILEDDD